MRIGWPRSVRGWLPWGGLVVAVLLLVGGARRRADEVPAADVAATATASDGADAAPTATSPATSGRPAAGESDGSLQIDGREREWRTYVPESLSASGDVPLVIGLHGGLGSGGQFAEDAYFDAQAERGQFIAVYPDGIKRGAFFDARTWNAGGCCGTAMNEDVDDVAFIETLIGRLVAELPIDEDRVYVTGHSNGAMMAQRLGCELADRVAAIAVYAGPLETSCAPSQPISVLNIHGDADENVLIGGGNGSRAVSDTDYTSLAETASTWVSLNDCAATPVVVVEAAVTTSTWGGCSDGVMVETQVIAGASHAWPGGAPTGPLRSDPSPDLDASAAIWDFLSAQVR